MKFILIFGPQAVGKMTVGHSLEKITDLKLFHNHMTIELLYPLFGFGAETWRLSDLFRTEIFEADLAERLERNKSEHRLEHKPTKRNVERSEKELKATIEKYRLNSNDGEITKKNYIRINNTQLSPDEAAGIIKEKFEL